MGLFFLPLNRKWTKSRSKRTYFVDFALGRAEVKLISTFVYRPSLETGGGRVYRVRDVNTGREDVVGIEFLKSGEITNDIKFT